MYIHFQTIWGKVQLKCKMEILDRSWMRRYRGVAGASSIRLHIDTKEIHTGHAHRRIPPISKLGENHRKSFYVHHLVCRSKFSELNKTGGSCRYPFHYQKNGVLILFFLPNKNHWEWKGDKHKKQQRLEKWIFSIKFPSAFSQGRTQQLERICQHPDGMCGPHLSWGAHLGSQRLELYFRLCHSLYGSG